MEDATDGLTPERKLVGLEGGVTGRELAGDQSARWGLEGGVVARKAMCLRREGGVVGRKM